MIDVVNKQNASILMRAIDLPRQPITMWAEVILSFNLLGEIFPTRPLCYFVPENVELECIINSYLKVQVEIMSLDSFGPLIGCQAALKGVRLHIKWLLIAGSDTMCGYSTTLESSYHD